MQGSHLWCGNGAVLSMGGGGLLPQHPPTPVYPAYFIFLPPPPPLFWTQLQGKSERLVLHKLEEQSN